MRYVARETHPYGRSLIDAAINIFVPGTNTPVTGLWDAATGGNELENPLITNDLGEIEFWADAPQTVELEITDNDGRVHAAGASTHPKSWTAYRRTVEVYARPDDIKLDLIDASPVVTLTRKAAPATLYAINSPHAVYDRVSDTTFGAYLGPSRALWVQAYEHKTGRLTEKEVGAYPIAQDDDHGAPSIAMDLNGYLHVVWGAHNSQHNHSKSNAPRSIAAWTTQAIATNGTYPNIAVDPATGDLYIIDRAGDAHGGIFPVHEFAGLRKSTDGGATWSATTPIIDTVATPEGFSDVYLRDVDFGPNGLHITWTVARGTVHDDVLTDVHHAVYDPATATMKTIGGTDLGAMVEWADHAACLVFAGVGIRPARHLFHDGRVYIAFVVDTSTCRVAEWDGATWTVTSLYEAPLTGTAVTLLVDNDDVCLTYAEGRYGPLSLARRTAPGVWRKEGVLLDSTFGDGIARWSAPLNEGGFRLLAQPMPTGGQSGAAAGIPSTTENITPIHALTRLEPIAEDLRVPAQRTVLYLPGTAGNYVSTPDHADLDITGDFEIVVNAALSAYAGGFTQALIGKWNSTGNQRSYAVRISQTGFMELLLSVDGTAALTYTSTAALAIASNMPRRFGVTRRQSDGRIQFWTAQWGTPGPVGGAGWTKIGADVIGTTAALHVGTAILEVGSTAVGTATPLAGIVQRAVVRNGIGGTIVADYRADTPIGPRYQDSTGKVWTINGSSWSWKLER